MIHQGRFCCENPPALVRNWALRFFPLDCRVPLQVVRRSGRIPKEIPILLIGSDLDGRLFSEPTKTVVLSLHGAGLVSKHKLCPEQELVLRWPERNKEAEIRVVGNLGTHQGIHTYGVAFLHSQGNFWETEFPPVSPAEREMGFLSLACSACKTVERVDDSGIEADICATGEGVIRFCKRCTSSTLWKPVVSHVPQEPAVPATTATAQMSLFPGPSAPATASAPPPSEARGPSFTPVASSSPAQIAEPRSTVLTLPPPDKPAESQVNRRRHPRVKVNYSACVRHPERGEEVVLCEDMSKGGLRFKSRKQYYAHSLIEIAAPYQPGQPAIFVPAQVVFVQELPEQQLFRHGVQYLKTIKHRDSF